MNTFEEVLKQYEPMISASIRTLNIYRDQESFRQTGRVALWQAWTRFDTEKGNFTPFAYRSIRGAMLDELKKENIFDTNTTQMDNEVLEELITVAEPVEIEWSDALNEALETLTAAEQELTHWIFVEGLSLGDCAKRVSISLPGIKKRRQKMLKKLREVLVR
ncbi:sigma-70 family RNA polymerase sigma factor [Sporosarcina siberiensis]|uniref:Sigma-70 family RNA polymerase sigma factor n=1 Tax=Sporosarcina siberiensis TaxID=1365606 RepID=A0ABW4SJA2_9BACL